MTSEFRDDGHCEIVRRKLDLDLFGLWSITYRTSDPCRENVFFMFHFNVISSDFPCVRCEYLVHFCKNSFNIIGISSSATIVSSKSKFSSVSRSALSNSRLAAFLFQKIIEKVLIFTNIIVNILPKKFLIFAGINSFFKVSHFGNVGCVEFKFGGRFVIESKICFSIFFVIHRNFRVETICALCPILNGADGASFVRLKAFFDVL